jgi:bifunctional UDP-N-acetylglucosamine pyrophosphorylase/glucosamine-1-phosphate N-acetyltransferase
LIEHVVRTAQSVSPKVFVIVGHQAEAVTASLAAHKHLRFIRQKEQLGTGHALLSGRRELERAASLLLVLSGDTPLLTPATLRRLLQTHRRSGAAATVLTADMADPTGYGRIVRAADGGVAAIVEQKSATPEQQRIREINSGIYCFQTRALFAALRRVRLDPIKKEYYLTDVMAVLRRQGLHVAACRASEPSEVIGINDRAELARVDSLLRLRKARELMLSGVTIWSPETVRIDPDVTVGTDTEIEPRVVLRGDTRIGKSCRIGTCSVIEASTLADNVTIRPSCVIEDSHIATGATVGPFAHLRPGAAIGPEARVGNFVEIKKASLGRGTRAAHLSYIGDATIGADVNVGCGTITVNYDGAHKHQTVVEDHAFIGSGSNLIAPVRVRRGGFVAAGSTITDEVPSNALAVARARQVNKPGWATRRKKRLRK